MTNTADGYIPDVLNSSLTLQNSDANSHFSDANSGVLRYQHSEYRVGDFAYIKPDAYTFPIKQVSTSSL